MKSLDGPAKSMTVGKGSHAHLAILKAGAEIEGDTMKGTVRPCTSSLSMRQISSTKLLQLLHCWVNFWQVFSVWVLLYVKAVSGVPSGRNPNESLAFHPEGTITSAKVPSRRNRNVSSAFRPDGTKSQ